MDPSGWPHPLTGTDLQRGGGNDELTGTPRSDLLRAGAGNDTLIALAGDDCLFGELFGGKSRDWLKAVGGERDVVNCGQGKNDRASVDEVDQVTNCENVRVG